MLALWHYDKGVEDESKLIVVLFLTMLMLMIMGLVIIWRNLVEEAESGYVMRTINKLFLGKAVLVKF